MPDSVNRCVLPIHDRSSVALTTYDVKDPETAFPSIDEVLPPEGSPNLLLMLVDDIGAASSFAAAISTPTADRLAPTGLKLTGFHTPLTSYFTGPGNWVHFDQSADDSSRLISPENCLRVATVRQ